jgi:hypothetical protein
MRKAILGVASAIVFASPAVAADLPVPHYSEVPGYEYRTAPPVVAEEPVPFVVAPPPVVVIRSMRQRPCTRDLLCMRTLGRLGMEDGAIEVTSAAVGKSRL